MAYPRAAGPIFWAGASTSLAKAPIRSSWFGDLASAWGETMDREASTINALCDQVRQGDDRPSTMGLLTASSLKFSFMAQAQQTSTSTLGSAMETMVRKQ